MTKLALTETLPNLPDEFSIDELIEQLLIVEKIEKGKQQYNEGKVLTSEEVRKRMGQWGK
jgi:predicted transcriptional regulator